MARWVVGFVALVFVVLAVGNVVKPYTADSGPDCGAAVLDFRRDTTIGAGRSVEDPCPGEARGRMRLSIFVLGLTCLGSWVVLSLVDARTRRAGTRD